MRRVGGRGGGGSQSGHRRGVRTHTREACVRRDTRVRRALNNNSGGRIGTFLPAGNRYAVLPCWYYMAFQYRVCTSACEVNCGGRKRRVTC